MLIIREPDKMFRDLRNSTGTRELSVMPMEVLVSGVNRNVLNVVFSLCMSECLAKLQDTAMTLIQCPHSLLRHPYAAGLSHQCSM
jgi:hypothetical protein